MRIRAILGSFAPITLQEMDGVKLLDRIDTKYVFGENLLPQVLEKLRPEYRVLEVDGERGSLYRTVYFDTPGYRHFNDHQIDRTLRSKVRYREYVGSGLSFLEVKRKTGRGRTSKVRRPVERIPRIMPGEHLAYVHEACDVREPHAPQLWNSFERFTFVHRTRSERLTIDRGLTFERDGTTAVLGPACIAELKRQDGDEGSPFPVLMEALGLRPTGLSKYCVGLWKLVPGMHYCGSEAIFRHVPQPLQEVRAAG